MISLYLTWRPSKLSDVIGQDHVVSAIKRAATTDRFAQGYLLAGPYGTGKTTIARLIAMSMTCQHKVDGEACGKCKTCVSIRSGYCADVKEMDGGSNTGVDEARKIRETAMYAPQELSKKIYIIDECHMLTTQAWSALLKTLEEPPPYAYFILCTTDARKLLSTIISRVQRFQLKKIPASLMAKRLLEVAKAEGVELEEGAALAIAMASKGAMRDAYSFLEQMTTTLGKKISSVEAREQIGLPDKRITNEVAKMIADRNVSGVLLRTNELLSAGVDVVVFLSELSEVFRSIMIAKECGVDTKLLDLSKDERDFLGALEKKMSLTWLIKMASVFGRIEKEVHVNINERLMLEAALINCILMAGNVETQGQKQSA